MALCRILRAAAAVLACAVHASPAASATLSAGRPAGFDGLERPQTALVDVYVGGVRIASTLARYTPAAVTFLKPEEVSAAVPHLKPDPRVRAALAAELPANAGAVCGDENRETCGRLSPPVAGVIFDEARFRADLFVSPAFLEVAAPLSEQYLPSPTGALTAISAAAGAVSGASRGAPSYGLQDRTVVSFGAARLTAEVSQSSGDGFRAETLAAAVDHGSLRYQAGLLWTPALDFFGQGRMWGASIGSQLDTLENKDRIAASPLLVFLDQRARVEVYRGERLLSAAVYEAGNQLIDTTDLPDGSYLVLLRIREAGGVTREEHRFFTRDRRLPPLGHPQFQLSVGSLLESDGGGAGVRSLVAQLRYARRLTQSLGVDGAVGYVDGSAVGAAGASWSTGRLQVRGGATASERGDYGVSFDTALSLGRQTLLTVDVRRAWTVADASSRTAALGVGAGVADFTALSLSRVAFAGEGLQALASLTTNVRGALMAINAAYNQFHGAAASYTLGAAVDAPLGHGRLEGLRLYASAAETDRGAQVMLALRYRFSRGRSAAFGQVGYVAAPRDEQGVSGAVADISVSHLVATRAGEADLDGNYDHSPSRDTVSASGQLHGPAGDVGATLEQDLSGSGAETRFSARFAGGIAYTAGRAAVGSVGSGQSGVVVRVDGPKDAVFRVLVNDAAAGRVSAGSSLSLFLPAYREYRLRLAPLGGGPLAFDTAERRVTLYPGNVAHLRWTASPELAVFGRVLDAHGEPLANARVEGGTTPSSTDANGWFQATVGAAPELVFTAAAGGSCRLSLGGVNGRSGYAALGTRTCEQSSAPPVAAASR